MVAGFFVGYEAMITACEFCERYDEWLDSIERSVTGSHVNAIHAMRETDPEDLVSPYAVFVSECHAIGFIFCAVVDAHEKRKKTRRTEKHIPSCGELVVEAQHIALGIGGGK